jgi:hypothetical protein
MFKKKKKKKEQGKKLASRNLENSQVFNIKRRLKIKFMASLFF